MRVYIRYEVPDENKETRRERNKRHHAYTPKFNIPDEGMYLWSWYEELSRRFQRNIDGTCRPIPPSEFLAWSNITGNVVDHVEYDILSKMDDVYCREMNNELTDYQARQEEKRRRESGK
jgi:hypothetical protein